MTKMYAKWRPSYPNKYARAPETLSLKWHFDRVYHDKLDDVSVSDQDISDANYTSWKRFAIIEFNEANISKADIEYDLRDLPCHVYVYEDATQAIAWVKDMTDLTEWDTWVFEVIPEWTDVDWNPTDAVNITID